MEDRVEEVVEELRHTEVDTLKHKQGYIQAYSDILNSTSEDV